MQSDYYIDGMQDFLDKGYEKCCNTCQYLCKKSVRFTELKPYCTFYDRVLNCDVLNDYCKTYTKKSPPYSVWYKDKAPANYTLK